MYVHGMLVGSKIATDVGETDNRENFKDNGPFKDNGLISSMHLKAVCS